MQPTTLALGGAAAVGVAFLLSRAKEEESVKQRFKDIDPTSVITGMDLSSPVQPPEPSALSMPSSTLEEWRRSREELENPTNIQDPAPLITPDPNPPQEVRGTPGWSNLDYLKAGGALLGAAAVVGGGGVIVNEWSKEQAYVSPDGFSNALALEEGRPE
jgi:hypothetical protein